MKLKKAVYLTATMFLGAELMFILHSLVEGIYLAFTFDVRISPVKTTLWIFTTYLPVYVPIIMLIAGAVGGFFLGKVWWQIVYVEKRHWKWEKKEEKKTTPRKPVPVKRKVKR